MVDFEELAEWPYEARPTVPASLRGGGSWPRVTLVTPSLNQAPYLEAALLSVLNQGYPDLEYMVIDGGSTDGSVDIIRRHAARLAHWESGPDRGQAHAINKGWARATGKYLWWLNADDMLLPGSLFRAVAFLEAHPEVDLVYGDLLRMDGEGRWIDRFEYGDFDLEVFLLQDRDLAQAGALARRSAIEAVGFLDEDLHYLMDKDLWLRLALDGRQIAHLCEPLAGFRIHPEAKTQAGSPRAAQERHLVARRVLASPALPPRVRQEADAIWSRVHVKAARTYMKCGLFGEAWVELQQAVRRRKGVLTEGSWWHTAGLALLGVLLGASRLSRLRAGIRRLRFMGRQV